VSESKLTFDIIVPIYGNGLMISGVLEIMEAMVIGKL